MKAKKGFFIVIEGIDGTGKSTLAQNIHAALSDEGRECLLTFEPTNGRWGAKLRESFTGKKRLSPEDELELFLKDREEHVEQEIRPALEAGKTIVCDRYYLSTMAYQGARGMDMEEIKRRNEAFAIEPDIALILELPVETALKRITETRGEQLNNFEQADYLERVAANFNKMDYPFIRRVDASLSPAELLKQALKHVRECNQGISQHLPNPQD